MIKVFASSNISTILDILVVTVILYAILVWFKKTRAVFTLIGIIIAIILYILARQFNLLLTVQIFQSLFAIALIIIVILFQQEIRYFFERLAILGLNQKFKKKQLVQPSSQVIEILKKTIFDFASAKIGALIIIQGKDPLIGHTDGGVELNGKLSEPILKSIFDPHSIGHDGAIIISGDTILQLSVHLPLSKNNAKLGQGGTRHAAALGLAEVTDALCLVVSEERGSVSIARDSDIYKIDTPENLEQILTKFIHEINPHRGSFWGDYIKSNFREKVMACSIATILWFVQIYSAELVYRDFDIPVIVAELPAGISIAEIDTKMVTVSFSAPRRNFFFMKPGDVHLTLSANDWKKGSRMIKLTASDLTFPEGIIMRGISPQDVAVKLESNNSNKSTK